MIIGLGLVLLSAINVAQAQVVSVNFGQSAYALGAGESAGVVSALNWNNGSTAGGGAIANLNNSAGAASGVGLTYVGGSGTNNINLTSSGNPGDNKMMSHGWRTNNEVIATNLFYNINNDGGPFTGTRFFQSLARVPSGGEVRDNTAVFTNLNAFAPNGYDVYVYVSGASASPNEVAGSSPAGSRNFVSPMHVLAGPSGLISTIQTGNTSDGGGHLMMSFGGDDPAGAGGGGGLSIENLSNLPAGTQRTILWPAVLKQNAGGGLPGGDYYSTDFQGFVAGTLNVTDNYPLDYGSPNEHGAQTTYDPAQWSDWPYNDVYGGQPVWDPTFRGIPLSNYILFEDLDLDTLEILARNIHGARTTAGSTGQFDMGAITGIQIVARTAAAAVPEPTSIALWSALAVVGLAVGFRRIRK